jgi:hypothetical protein
VGWPAALLVNISNAQTAFKEYQGSEREERDTCSKNYLIYTGLHLGAGAPSGGVFYNPNAKRKKQKHLILIIKNPHCHISRLHNVNTRRH